MRIALYVMSNKKGILYSICLVLFMDAVGGGLIFPILPALFIDQHYGLLTHDSYFSREVLYALSFAMFPLASMFGMPILGQIADKYGKGTTMLYGLVGIILTDLLCILAIIIGSIWLFLLTRLLVGFLAGTYAAGMAMISDISNNDDDRISNFKLATLASLIGILLGPGFSIFIDCKSQTNPFIIPFVIATMLGILSFVALWFNFRRMGVKMTCSPLQMQEVDNKLSNHQSILSSAMLVSSLFYVFINTNTRFLFISFFFLQFGFGLYCQSLSLFFVTTFLYTPQKMGLLLVITSIVSMVSMYILQPWVIKYYKYQSLIKINLVLTSAVLIVYARYSYSSDHNLKEYESISLVALLTLYVFMPFIFVGFTNLFANSVGSLEQGKIMGSSGQISSLASLMSALLMGQLLAMSYFILVILSAVALMLSYIMLKYYLTQ